MLKKVSFPIILAAISLSSCRSVRLADVLPETKGTPMGAVTIGRENVDFFVIPEAGSEVLPFEFNTFGEDGAVASASSVVVFKTRERHPVHRTMHGLGAPVRAFDNVTATALDKAVGMAHSLVNRPDDAISDGTELPGAEPPLLPEGVPGEIPGDPGYLEAEPVDSDILAPEPFANPVATAADHTEPQTNRNRG